ncbi:LacI family DNA-binding transcriptional regulator [Ideonella alba]|uniref:LacI family DNA-binding transcriptional regulator n=1 Tax=Ideonella alba TaxID=2824118 RepID=A0A940Y9W8_9BURK|nr:LacI family DNA-binding transcriptional regulator [Ideonella alba]MBQ0930338.1 LacI family DNA-binding transcriptional regulator [Ideonella alba]
MSSPKPPKKTHSVVPGQTVTLEQVAAHAGVSPSTVSRILNGTAVVSPAKKAAVEAAIQELGFRPNPVARGLAGGRTMSIGVVTQIISSPFYGEALLGIEEQLEQAGYVPLIVSGHWRDVDERKALQTLLARRVDGLIVFAGRLSAADLLQEAAGLPLVVMGRQVQGPQAFSFSFDNRKGARLATEHLLAQGHRRIAFVMGDPVHDDAADRYQGYLDALAAAGLAADPALLTQGDYTEGGGLLAITHLLARGQSFSAVFSCNDQMAIGAAHGLRRHGLRVPDDVSLVGFDDVVLARYAMPPLTTVRQSMLDMGHQAAKAVLDQLAGRPPQVQLPAPELVVRDSTRRLAR